MFRQIKYLLIELKPVNQIEPKVSKIKSANFSDIGVVSVITVDDRTVFLDWADTLLAEFTGKFDKAGSELFTGDLVEITKNESAGPVKDIYVIGWTNGGFTASHLKDQNKGFNLFDELTIMEAVKIGNQFENQQIIIDYLELDAKEKMEGTDGEISGEVTK